MKTYFLNLFLAFQMPLFGQLIYERTFVDDFPSIERFFELSDSSTFSIYREPTCNGVRIRHIDARGNLLENHLHGSESFSVGAHLIGVDSILIWFETGAYDVGPDSFKVMIWTPDSVEILHREEIRYMPFNTQYGGYILDKDYLTLQKADTLFLKNLATKEIETYSLFNNITSVIQVKNALFIVQENGAGKLVNYELDVINSIQLLTVLPFEINSSLALDSFLVNQSPGQAAALIYFNLYSEEIMTVDLSGSLDSIDNLQVNKDVLYVMGKQNNQNVVLMISASGQILSKRHLDLPSLDKEFTYRFTPTRAYAWSYDGIGGYKANYRMVYRYLEPTPIHYVDLSLDSVWVGTVTDFDFYHIIELFFLISNHSQDSVTDFTIHYDEGEEYSYCFSSIHASYFADKLIEPDGSYVLRYVTYTTSLTHSNSFQYNFFVEHGNNHLDQNTADNSFLLNYIISSTEPVGDKLSVDVYPNPFSNQLFIESEKNDVSIMLYNQFGQLITSGSDKFEDLESLASGLYFIVISDGVRTTVKRVVKE